MEEINIFNWHSVDSLPLFSATIEIILDETIQQHAYIHNIKNQEHFVEKIFLERIINFYQSQLGKILYYKEQFERWRTIPRQGKHDKKISTVNNLIKKVEKIKNLTHSILETANEVFSKQNNVQKKTDENNKIILNFIKSKNND